LLVTTAPQTLTALLDSIALVEFALVSPRECNATSQLKIVHGVFIVHPMELFFLVLIRLQLGEHAELILYAPHTLPASEENAFNIILKLLLELLALPMMVMTHVEMT
jgi:hypothetical protein